MGNTFDKGHTNVESNNYLIDIVNAYIVYHLDMCKKLFWTILNSEIACLAGNNLDIKGSVRDR